MKKKTKELLQIGIAKLLLIHDGMVGKSVNPYQTPKTPFQEKAFSILRNFYSRYDRVWIPKTYSAIFDPIFEEELKNKRIYSLVSAERKIMNPVKREIPPYLRNQELSLAIFLSFIKNLRMALVRNMNKNVIVSKNVKVQNKEMLQAQNSNFETW